MDALLTIGILILILFLIVFRAESHNKFIDKWRPLINHSEFRNEFEKFLNEHYRQWGEYKVYKKYLTQERQQQIIESSEKLLEYEKKWDERQKREATIRRVFAYPHEDFIFSLYAPYAVYDSAIEKWSVGLFSSVTLSKDSILEKIKEYYSLSDERAVELFCEFVNNRLLDPSSQGSSDYCLGSTLNHTPNVISSEDMNLDKWIRAHQAG